jgi:hypothetical protein
VRLAGSLLSIEPDSSEAEPAPRPRLILPMTGAEDSSAAPGAISILRGR